MFLKDKINNIPLVKESFGSGSQNKNTFIIQKLF